MDWLTTELLTGFQKLLCLGLDRTPASDLLQGTVLAWREAITAGRDWDEQRDAPRIRQAFVTLATARETWPAPRHFLDALPRIEQRALGYEVKPASPEQAQARLAEIRRVLDEPLPEHTPKPHQRVRSEGVDHDAIERELQQHYTDRKSAAAGDA